MKRGRNWAAVAVLAAAGLAIALGWSIASGAAAPTPGEPVRRAFEIAVHSSTGGGAVAPGAADFTVSLDGSPVAVTEARPIAAGGWQIVIYVDGLVAKREELQRAATALASASAQLASLGPVTLLVADTLVEPWLEDTTDRDELESSFAELGEATFETPESRGADFPASRRATLLDQLGRRPSGTGARALLVVGDVNGERSSGRGAGDSRGGADGDDAPARRGELATAVASLGWVTLPLYLGPGVGVAVSPLAEETGGEVIVDGPALGPALERLAAGRLLRVEVPISGPDRASGAPGGGDDATGIATAAIVPLSVVGPPAWGTRASRWLATSTPDFVLRARVEALLAEEDTGDLDVAASAALDADAAGDPELAVEVLAMAPGTTRRFAGASSRLRASLVLARLEDEPIVVHHRGAGGSLDGAGSWLLQARLDVPEDLDAVVAMVEDLATGEWGIALAELDGEGIEVTSGGRVASEVVDLRRRSAAPPATASSAPQPTLVRLVPPRARELAGTQTFRAMSLNAFIDRVVFLLDDRQVAEDRDDPFAGHIDLGPQPSQHTVTAVAYDRAGRELGRDAVTVNRPRTAYGVRIVEVNGAAAGVPGTLDRVPGTLDRVPGTMAQSGPIEVTAEVSVPPRQRVARVEFYFNETLAARLEAPPWKATLRALPPTGGDYVRVVAHLDDGSSLEDVQIVGATGSVERVEVNLVEIFTVVLDRDGTPVRDLERGEVTVRLGAKPVELERFGVAEDLPLDVGIVIDTSQSMEVLMDDTRQAAVRFIADLVRPGDRAFLVDFDTKPRLAHAMTRNMMDLIKAMGSLRADGNTALFDSIVFSILHFEEGEDRRAVVLLTDGDDYKSRFSQRQAALQARAAGTPVYMVSLAGMDWLRPAMKKDDLELIARQTGGHVFYVSAKPELDQAYARIGAELRSQYVLAFATDKPLTEEELAKLEVRVSRPGATVRAVVAGRSVQTR